MDRFSSIHSYDDDYADDLLMVMLTVGDDDDDDDDDNNALRTISGNFNADVEMVLSSST